jgi:hypothetical protein
MRLNEQDSDERFIQLQDCNHMFGVDMLDGYMQSCFPVSTQSTHMPSHSLPESTNSSSNSSSSASAAIDEQEEVKVNKDIFVKKVECPCCKKAVQVFPTRYANNVKSRMLILEDIKRLMSGPAMRLKITQTLKSHGGREGLQRAIERLEQELDRNDRSATCHSLLGEMLRQMSSVIEKKKEKGKNKGKISLELEIARLSLHGNPTSDKTHEFDEFNSMQLRAQRHLETCLKLLALTSNGDSDIDPNTRAQKKPSCVPALSSKQLSNEAFHALLQLAMLYNAKTGMVDKARSLLDKAKEFAAKACINAEFLAVMDSALQDVHAAEKQLQNMAINADGIMRGGAWHRCPNEHLYQIGNCGGANQISRCPDCKSQIGGTDHVRLPGNTRARDFEQSLYGRVSEAYDLTKGH